MASSQPNRLFTVGDSASSPYGTCSSELIAIFSAKSREDVINYLTVKYKKYIPVDKLRLYFLRRYDKKKPRHTFVQFPRSTVHGFRSLCSRNGEKFYFSC